MGEEDNVAAGGRFFFFQKFFTLLPLFEMKNEVLFGKLFLKDWSRRELAGNNKNCALTLPMRKKPHKNGLQIFFEKLKLIKLTIIDFSILTPILSVRILKLVLKLI